ncbi:MAG: Outer membrane protein [candidate division TM6 bacterium GW2011_GWF2_36_131]|nr:MAG: Outer membrane protein [candidate division TM6 bacterium GW2011_GWF2_36_131]
MGIAFSVPQVKWGGCMRLDMFADTRQTYSTPDGAWMLWPEKIVCDDQGCDINAQGRFGISPAYSWIYVSAKDKIGETKVKAHIEADFGSEFPVGLMNIREAFVRVKWEKSSLLVGEYVYPLVAACSPRTIGWHGGGPAAPYAYFPQVCLTYKTHDVKFIFSPYSEFDYVSTGPIGGSNSYVQNSMTPALYAGVEVDKETFKTGIGFGVKRLLPALSTTTTSTTSLVEKTIVHDKSLASFLGAVYGKVKLNDYVFRAEAIIAQNGFDLVSIGGYAVWGANPFTGARSYTNINYATGWIDVEYKRHEKLQPGVFIGYAKNLGTRKSVYLDDNCEPIFYGDDEQVAATFRFTPRIRSDFNNIEIGFEADFVFAWFGKMNRKGKQSGVYRVGNFRPLLITAYYF